MQNQRAHPLFSGFGCATAILFVLFLVAILVLRGGGPFSSGPLTDARPRQTPLADFASHAQFEQQCTLCHTPWQGIAAELCEQCHTTIAEQRQTSAGLHGQFVDAQRCQTCHTDHAGREAKITRMSLSLFDHDRLTNFSLMTHQTDFDQTEMTCDDCHKEAIYTIEAVDCQTCHTQADTPFMAEHVDLFGPTCLECHQGRGETTNFNHNLIFVLDGAHEEATCKSCHAEQQFEETPRTCANCHEEPTIHVGQFGLECERCHSTTAWAPAQLMAHNFPLDHGDEGEIPCQTCHLQNYVEYTCTNCHAHPEQEMREVHLEEGITDYAACADCHPTGLEDEAESHEGENDDD